ncbi:hypothetical protein [Bailinhaonella thermotolerans]|uniref:Uncharacterized protein n=1 Tax=Bailinhaonella thermotolerans TaxID=1070861 RepID=A0A3A4API2_9ACTN|nr:hypothetical protein [Bailinhaonella thermotolerans]RJL21249.1 hypothetical protein D5H75_37925 [Bailinhaonella thermotolerans]
MLTVINVISCVLFLVLAVLLAVGDRLWAAGSRVFAGVDAPPADAITAQVVTGEVESARAHPSGGHVRLTLRLREARIIESYPGMPERARRVPRTRVEVRLPVAWFESRVPPVLWRDGVRVCLRWTAAARGRGRVEFFHLADDTGEGVVFQPGVAAGRMPSAASCRLAA